MTTSVDLIVSFAHRIERGSIQSSDMAHSMYSDFSLPNKPSSTITPLLFNDGRAGWLAGWLYKPTLPSQQQGTHQRKGKTEQKVLLGNIKVPASFSNKCASRPPDRRKNKRVAEQHQHQHTTEKLLVYFVLHLKADRIRYDNKTRQDPREPFPPSTRLPPWLKPRTPAIVLPRPLNSTPRPNKSPPLPLPLDSGT